MNTWTYIISSTKAPSICFNTLSQYSIGITLSLNVIDRPNTEIRTLSIVFNYCVSDLQISLKTTVVAVEVTFHYKDSQNVLQYEAYVDRHHKCSRPGNKPPLRCLIKGLEEAKEYAIYARVCLSGKANCEPKVKEIARTELRGKFKCCSPALSWRAV